jgi:hypothetical protein
MGYGIKAEGYTGYKVTPNLIPLITLNSALSPGTDVLLFSWCAAHSS